MTGRHSQLLRRRDIAWAKGVGAPPFARKRRTSKGRKGQGNRYERKLSERLEDEFQERWVPGPWIQYQLLEGRTGFAQPDGLIINLKEGKLTIVEAKYQHCVEAYFQLIGKYLPLAEVLFPKEMWEIAVVEVVKWFDPAVVFPGDVNMLPRIGEAPCDKFNVHIWRP